MDKKEKLPVFKFKTNIPAKVLFQSDILKEGDSQYGHWKMYKIQINAVDYIFYPTAMLQSRLDQIGKLKGRQLEIGMYESDNGKKYWQIFDENDEEIDYDYSKSPQTPVKKIESNSGQNPLLVEMNKKLDNILMALNPPMKAIPTVQVDDEIEAVNETIDQERDISDDLPF